MAQLFANNATAFLIGEEIAGDTNLSVTPGKGALFPSPTGGDFFYATLVETDIEGAEIDWEVVRCTARSNDELTVVRGQDNTIARTWPVGTRIELRLTAGNADTFATVEDKLNASAYTAADVKTKYETNADTNAFTDADESKLDGIDAGATLNATDAALRARSSHTGTQTLATISDSGALAPLDTVDTAQIDNDAVTFAKMQNVSTNDRVLGRVTAGAGDPEELTAAQIRTMIDVENGATADQSNAEIKTAYEANTNTNAFSDTEQTKLSNIEIAATADQTDAEIRAAVEAATDSNVFTDADHTKLNGIAEGAQVNDATTVLDADIGVTVQGYTAVLAATDQSFTTALKNKLDAVEALADVTDAANVDAAGAVMNTDASTSGMSFVIDEDTMVTNSSTRIPTQQSVKAYVDGKVASGVTYEGGYNAGTNTPNLDLGPAGITVGNMYTVTAAGNFFTEAVEIGDVLICEQDNPTTLAHWTVVNKNLDASGIKAAYESNSDTNVFLDAEKTKLTGIDSGAEVNDPTTVLDADIGVTVQGYTAVLAGTTASFTTADETKLDGIDSGAEVNPAPISQAEAEAGVATTERIFTAQRVAQAIATLSPPMSNADVKTAYEANADTNEFSDAEQTKLAGIADGAQVNDLTTLLDADIGVTVQAQSAVLDATTASFLLADETKLDGISAGAEVNPAVVSQVDAEAGTSTAERTWTAQRVSQAIAALAAGSETFSVNSYTMAGGETSKTGLTYTVGQLNVYLNGALLLNGTDYIATTGTSITGMAALAVNDILEIHTWTAQSIGAFTGGMNDINDATISAVSTNDLLAWNGSAWVNVNDITVDVLTTTTASDQHGDLRTIPSEGAAKTSSYSLAVADVGQFVTVGTGGSITIPNSTFSAGDVITIYNDTTGDITITNTITTAYKSGTNTDEATFTLATRGLVTLLFISGTVVVASGNI